MYSQHFTVIGISDSRHQELPREAIQAISSGHIFTGGRRHHEIMRDILPDGHKWIEITVPLSDVFKQYRNHSDIVVFASGDPLFYGFAATLQREFPDSRLKVIPTFNSLQMLAHRMRLPYQDMINTSVTGRPWKGLDDALIKGERLIGVLTDRKKGPSEIAGRLLEYGYWNYEMTIGESLGNDSDERVTTMRLDKAVATSFGHPNCVILRQTSPTRRRFGIPEEEFHHLDGRAKMITKMPIRLVTLSMLDLCNRTSFWDVGFCTGSVSIEARLQFPHLAITSFEKRDECKELMHLNCIRHGAPDITAITGDFLKTDLSSLPRPDAVFIGGHGGRLSEMLGIIDHILMPEGVIVFNSVSDDSCHEFEETIARLGRTITCRHHIALDEHNPITILKAQ